MSELLVAIPDGMDQDGIEYLQKHSIGVIPTGDSRRMGIEELAKQSDAIAVRSATKVTNVPEEPRVKIYGRIGSGTDNFNRVLQQINRLGIPIVNSPEPNVISVSELVNSYLLHDARGVHEMIEASSRGEWAKGRYKGSQLYGKSLGVVGTGLIGANVASIGNAFGMRVLAFDVRQDLSLPNVRFVDLDVLLQESDYVTVHTPLSDKPIIGEREFELMKSSAVLIHTARGGVVDETALVKALETGQIRRAYVDVFTNEPFNGNSPDKQPSNSLQKLLQLPNAYCTPHIGAETEEGQREGSLIIARRLTNYLLYGYLDSLCNGHINPALNNLRGLFHRAGMFMGQYSQSATGSVKILIDGDLRETGESTRNQLMSSLLTGLYFSEGKYVNPLNLERRVRGVEFSIANAECKRENTFRVELEDKGITYIIEVANDSGELVGFGYRKKGEEPRYFTTRSGLHGNLAILEHDNVPGALAVIADRFARRNVNINNASNSSQDGRAITVLDLASPLKNGIVEEIIRGSPLQYGDHQINFHKGSSFSLPPKNAF